MSFPYKKVLVVGATSGIGQVPLATKFLANGISVVAVGRRSDRLDTFKQSHSSTNPSVTVDTHAFDISKLSEIPDFASTIAKAHPDLDCVWLNSGLQRVVDWTKPSSVDLSSLDLEVLTNYTSYLHLTKAFLSILQSKAPKPTALIYTTSGLALVPLITAPNYSATKAALHHHILAMRAQLQAKDGNNVTIVELFPPAVQTELHDFEQGEEKGRQFGMPLDDFVEEAWEGLSAGKDQVAVQMAKTAMGFDGWEQERQKGFAKMVERMRGAKV